MPDNDRPRPTRPRAEDEEEGLAWLKAFENATPAGEDDDGEVIAFATGENYEGPSLEEIVGGAVTDDADVEKADPDPASDGTSPHAPNEPQ